MQLRWFDQMASTRAVRKYSGGAFGSACVGLDAIEHFTNVIREAVLIGLHAVAVRGTSTS